MLCPSCASFCVGVAAEIAVKFPEVNFAKDVNIQWTSYCLAVHNRLSSIEVSSQALCCICRLIWHGLSEEERNRDDVLSIDLELDPSDRGLPILYVRFVGTSLDSLKTRRLLAMYSGASGSSKY
jgi:hypothetical protein